MPVLLVVGIALVVFGAVVLLRFPDRPGGRIAWHGMEVSSVGAGLPLIVVGVMAVAVSGGRLALDGDEDGGRPDGPTGTIAAGCVEDYLAGVPSDRRFVLAAGVQDRDLVPASEPKAGRLGLVFSDGDARVGAARLAYDSENELFAVESVVGASCDPLEDFENATRPGGDRRVLQNFDALRMRLGGRTYDLHLGVGSTIRVDFVRFEP